MSRRSVLRAGGAGFGLFLLSTVGGRAVAVEVPATAVLPGGTLDPASIPKFASALVVPPAMPRSGTVRTKGGKRIDHYVISMRQFAQQVLPAGLPPTTLWGYGPVARGGQKRALHHAPSLTIEAEWGRPVRVTWVNELVDAGGRFRPHLLPVDPTLHWANPPGGTGGRDTEPAFAETPAPYRGPVPMVTHLHGAGAVGDESDGYPEAWFLPTATDVPADHARVGTWYDFFASKAAAMGMPWAPGTATAQYPNIRRARTLWFHDHTLGMTRVNVYAGPAGFYLIRGGPDGDDAVRDARTGRRAVLPGPAPGHEPPASDRRYLEIPLVIQDRSFDADGSLFYPDTRAFFDGQERAYLPHSDLSPIWNPEFFGNTLIVNGRTWPYLDVEQRRYRFRLLNGCNSRFLILDFSQIPGVRVAQIGSDGGFLAAPVDLSGAHRGRLLLAPAERADVVVDFTAVPVGNHVLGNLGPDEPFGGGEPGDDFPAADPETTGRVMQIRVRRALGRDRTTPPEHLVLPAITPLPPAPVRKLALIEMMSQDFDDSPVEALLGRVEEDGRWVAEEWADAPTQTPTLGATETWELYNTTGDAHPIHIHEVAFQVLDRQPVVIDEAAGTVAVAPGSEPRPREPWEVGFKDTVIAYPGEVTRVRMRFETAGQFVWHCHILEHEDNEMMRPYRIGPPQAGQPMDDHGGH
ncbi:bilirubin oxidase [Georgenia yuyongxinii]|uniref:Bilirubin oxidase n=1 Tax=Georgenia yuyongxinii TaxID=2589797 RepID=A0A5B8C2S4_9MICO|nr:multicopper oxidase [Georgenia yuyongxinii]QDC23522.1 bilirubin oxidase [Georgenia yuyongxinii]